MQVGYCLDAASKLKKEGISAEVINLRSIKPLDRDTIIASVNKTHRCAPFRQCLARFACADLSQKRYNASCSVFVDILQCRRGLAVGDAPILLCTCRCVAVEEGWPQSGVASEISALIMELAFDSLDAPVERVTGVEVPMPYAANLEAAALPSIDDIVRVAKRIVVK
jgi:pyruvate dehydrogenase E1 component beta subunit